MKTPYARRQTVGIIRPTLMDSQPGSHRWWLVEAVACVCPTAIKTESTQWQTAHVQNQSTRRSARSSSSSSSDRLKWLSERGSEIARSCVCMMLYVFANHHRRCHEIYALARMRSHIFACNINTTSDATPTHNTLYSVFATKHFGRSVCAFQFYSVCDN